MSYNHTVVSYLITMFLLVSSAALIVSIPNGSVQAAISEDGSVAEGEYDFTGEFAGGDLVLHWTVKGDTIFMAMEGSTTGWVSIGIGYQQAMKDSDMIFGWVDSNGTAHILDTYSTGPTGPHPPDTDMGGSDDILSFSGSEQDGITTIEFSRKLQTGDDLDNPIMADGVTDILWALGADDDPYSYHYKVGYATIDISTGETTSETAVELWPVHALFMTLGVLGMIVASALLFRKGMKNRLKVHMYLMTGASTSALIGIISGILMVEWSTGEHMDVAHSWLGLLTLLMAFSVLFIGFYFIKTENLNLKKHLRKWHIRAGWVGVTLMILAALSGFLQAVVID